MVCTVFKIRDAPSIIIDLGGEVHEVYYCQSVEDADEAGLGKSKLIYEELKKIKSERSLKMIQLPLDETQENPMLVWKKKS